MGIFDSIVSQVVGNVKRDVEYKASSGISNSISSGASKVLQKDSTPKCPKCKKVISDPSLKFCSECGTKLMVSCSKCQQDFPIGTKFCSNCGGAVK
ncbi:zinc ribbon domain-containing protein [Candidatus Micrarchaeota archaeon]|nr:zinc ribbon domain-containing protein [Candidatus Micrarchaeota archaeon]